uniref:Secreted protein n=1 Tax=Zonotrichia albicollis TaxID=44394 RepID=A0A8D2N7L9_ZONAL
MFWFLFFFGFLFGFFFVCLPVMAQVRTSNLGNSTTSSNENLRSTPVIGTPSLENIGGNSQFFLLFCSNSLQ